MILVGLVSLQDTSVIGQSQKKFGHFSIQIPMILLSRTSWSEFQFVLETLPMIQAILVTAQTVALEFKLCQTGRWYCSRPEVDSNKKLTVWR